VKIAKRKGHKKKKKKKKKKHRHGLWLRRRAKQPARARDEQDPPKRRGDHRPAEPADPLAEEHARQRRSDRGREKHDACRIAERHV
jgi:hypothetical protein